MLKSLIYFLGLCSFVQATNIDVIEIPKGRERVVEPNSVVIIAISSEKEQVIESLQNPNKPWGVNLFIGLDGTLTCFVPNDSQLKNTEKFPFKSEYARREREKVKNINNDDYASLANYLMHGCYATGLSCDMDYGWRGETGCAKFSINIQLRRMIFSSNLYTDQQIDVVYNVLQALTNEGINNKNIIGLSDIDLFSYPNIPGHSFWRQFYERHSGFLSEPRNSTFHNINNADELENALLKIGYTNPIDPKRNEKLIGDNCWLRRAISAFIFHYLPEEKLTLDLLDETLDSEDSYLGMSKLRYQILIKKYPPVAKGYSKELTYNMLKNEHPEILSAIEQIANI